MELVQIAAQNFRQKLSKQTNLRHPKSILIRSSNPIALIKNTKNRIRILKIKIINK